MKKKKVIRIGQVSALPQGCMVGHACDCKMEGRWVDKIRGFHDRYRSRYSSRMGSRLSIRRLEEPIPSEPDIDIDELVFENLVLKATIESCISPEKAEAFDEEMYSRMEKWEPAHKIDEEDVVALVKSIWKGIN